jgi:hypothetical protein
MSLLFYRRSVRSGYAFAHQEGFGRLITSGKMMRPPTTFPSFQVYNLYKVKKLVQFFSETFSLVYSRRQFKRELVSLEAPVKVSLAVLLKLPMGLELPAVPLT